MGTVTTTIEVGDPQGRNFQEVELTVDTGSTFTALPAKMLHELGVPVDETVPSGSGRRQHSAGGYRVDHGETGGKDFSH